MRIIVAVLLATQAALLYYSSRANFVTADEPGYFAAAITHWRRGEFDLYRVNPPLVRMLAVVPVLPQGVAEDYSHWRPELPGSRGERIVGRGFVTANGARYVGLIRTARLSTILWALLGGWLIFAWGRRLFGERAGLLGLALWCFEPNVLAHGCLMTPDIPATVLGLAAMFVFAGLLEQPSRRRTYAAGALLGLALLTKFTNLYLLVAWPIMMLVARRRAGRAPIGLRPIAIIAATALVIVNAGYGFHDTLRPLGSLAFTSETLTGEPPPPPDPSQGPPTGNRFRDTWLGWLPVPVPADYVKGMDVQRRDFEHNFRSYLNGVWRDHGWWHYYLYALAIKVPLGTLALVLAGLVMIVRDRKASSVAMVAVLLPVALVLLLVSSQVGFNSHMRYVLPIFPFLMIAGGRVAAARHRATRVAAAAVFAVSFASSLRVYPHSLSYFNELVGPARGDEHLLDSNIDWGQDALALAEWVDRNAPNAPLALAYFGGADPLIIGLRYTLPARFDSKFVGLPASDLASMTGPRPGLFAVSVNFLRGLAFDAPDGSGQWQPVDPPDFTYLARFRPIATAGYSIRIYCVDAAEANAARTALGLQPLPPAPPSVDCAAFR